MRRDEYILLVLHSRVTRMTTPAASRTSQTKPRRLHIMLRDGGVLDGGVYLTEGHALAPYLSSRKGGWMNIVNAVWLSEGQTHNHAVVQCDDILFASSPGRDVHVSLSVSGGAARDVDISLEDGTRVRGQLQLAARQRMSDYLSACGKFVPVLNATHLPSGVKLGDIALSAECVKAVRDARAFDASAPTPAQAKAEWGGLRRASSTDSDGTAAEIVEGASAKPFEDEPNESSYTPEEKARAERLARHWLVQLAVQAKLLPPDPRPLGDRPSLEEVWGAITERNDIAGPELATLVAVKFKLDLANLDEVSPEAMKIVPEKMARKLAILPVKTDGRTLLIAVSDPGSVEIENQLRFVTRQALKFAVAPPEDIRGGLDWYYGTPSL